jgi:putative phage-type endonuclease
MDVARNMEHLCIKYGLDANSIVQCNPEVNEEDLKKVICWIENNKNKVQYLLKIPKIEQKSEEWYRVRENLITASDFAQALGHGKFGNQNDIIKKKVKPVDESGFSKMNPFFKWGNMFEPLACKIYSLLHHNIIVHEFGLIQHETRKYFGASPDGITEYGVMLEIKCPYKRKIEVGGEVPKQYYYQIQGQLEVCGLTDCDYFECQFNLFKSREEFEAIDVESNVYIGIIIETEPAQYVYSDVSKETGTLLEWLDDFLERDNDFIDVKFWYLSHYNLQRVKLDKAFVEDNLDQLEVFWNKIVEYRNNPQKYKLEVEKTIDIGETSRLYPLPNNKITGYAFVEDPDDTN